MRDFFPHKIVFFFVKYNFSRLQFFFLIPFAFQTAFEQSTDNVMRSLLFHFFFTEENEKKRMSSVPHTQTYTFKKRKQKIKRKWETITQKGMENNIKTS